MNITLFIAKSPASWENHVFLSVCKYNIDN